MKHRIKAALLSAFVFPGLGHIVLKKYGAGAVLAGTALTALVYLVAKAVATALEISDKIQRGEVQLDTGTVTEIVSGQAAGADSLLLNIATIVLILCWVTGIVDSYRVGRTLDQQQREGS